MYYEAYSFGMFMLNNKNYLEFVTNPLFIIALFSITGFCYLYLDKPVADFFYQLDIRQQWPILSLITFLGKWQLAALVLLVLAFLFQLYKRESVWRIRLWFLLSCVLICNVIAVIFKIILGRARPDLWFDSQLYGFYWFKFYRPYWSFPSGHTTTVFSIITALGLIFPRHFWWLFIIGLSLVSTRVLLYHHYLSDVLMTIYITIIEVNVIGLAYQMLTQNKPKED